MIFHNIYYANCSQLRRVVAAMSSRVRPGLACLRGDNAIVVTRGGYIAARRSIHSVDEFGTCFRPGGRRRLRTAIGRAHRSGVGRSGRVGLLRQGNADGRGGARRRAGVRHGTGNCRPESGSRPGPWRTGRRLSENHNARFNSVECARFRRDAGSDDTARPKNRRPAGLTAVLPRRPC